jgi:DNA modification methylase
MSHQSETSYRLDVTTESRGLADEIHFVQMAARPTIAALEQLQTIATTAHPQAILAVLTSPENAARLIPDLEKSAYFKLWIAIKTRELQHVQGRLPNRHAALLVFSRYKGVLRHTKTRIGYTYCPSCGKTTKDYGGKKHTYHEYGTLMSDVWRDVSVTLDGDVSQVLDRLCAIFALDPHKTLVVHDLRDQADFEMIQASPFELEHPEIQHLESNLFNGDCIAQLNLLPSNSIDFCFADPPYNIKKRYDHWDDALEIQEYFDWCDRWLSEMARVLKPGCTLAVLNIPLWAVRHFTYLTSLPGLQFQNWIVWEGLSLPVRMIMPAHYGILCFSKGQPRDIPGTASTATPNSLQVLEEGFCLRASCVEKRNSQRSIDRNNVSDLWSDIHRIKHNSKRVDHPCQLPPLLMERLLAVFTNPDEVVLDPFNGSGTTTLVAAQMNRRFIGIELSPKYHALAQSRHAELEQGIDPFGKKSEIPKTKNSYVRRVAKQKYEVSKKTLQLEVRRIAQVLGHIPNRSEVTEKSAYPIEYFEAYFLNWAEVTAAARTTGMTERPAERVLQASLFTEMSVESVRLK